jgi:hypothetical protein
LSSLPIQHFNNSTEGENDMYEDSAGQREITVEKATDSNDTIRYKCRSCPLHYCFIDNNRRTFFHVHEAGAVRIKPMKCMK